MPELPTRDEMEPYRYRVVFDANDLREKALIFSLGLDDRYVAIVKFIMSALFQDKHPDRKMLWVRFANEPEIKILMLLEGNHVVENSMSMDAYNRIAEDYGTVMDEKSKNCYFVNRAWAYSVCLNEQ